MGQFSGPQKYIKEFKSQNLAKFYFLSKIGCPAKQPQTCSIDPIMAGEPEEGGVAVQHSLYPPFPALH